MRCLVHAKYHELMKSHIALTTLITNLQIRNESDSEKLNTEQFQLLVNFIDDLIQNDFNRLLSILYRVDISEEKLKQMLAENKNTEVQSAEIIANLLIEREEEKIKSRAK